MSDLVSLNFNLHFSKCEAIFPFWATMHFAAYDFIVAPNKNGLLATPNTTTALNYLYGSKNYLHIYFP